MAIHKGKLTKDDTYKLILIAWSYAEISEGRAVELTGKSRDVLRKDLKQLTGVSLPDGQFPNYDDLRELPDLVRRLRAAMSDFGGYAKVLMIDNHVTPDYLEGFREKFEDFERVYDECVL